MLSGPTRLLGQGLTPAAVVLLALAGAACQPPPAPPPPPPSPYDELRPPPARGPRELDHVTAVALTNRGVIVGSAAGLVRLDPVSGAFVLLPDDERVSHAFVSGLAVDGEGRLWSGHRRNPARPGEEPSPERREGGVRRFREDGLAFESWFADDGLGTDHVECLAAGGSLIGACVGDAYALLDLEAPAPAWAARLDRPTRRVTVVDPLQGPDATRTVVEFRPPHERVTDLAIAEGAVRVGTSEGLYVDGPDGFTRIQVPCRLAHRQPGRVVAVAARPGPIGTVAVLAFAEADGGFRPAGVLDLPSADDHACLVPGLDVPDAPALAVAVDGDVTWLATHLGLVRMEAGVVDLLDPLSGAPAVAVTAVVGDGHGGCWAGTWGAGVFHLQGESWRLYAFRDGSTSRASITEGRLR